MAAELSIEVSRIHIVADEDGPAKGFDLQLFGPTGAIFMVLHAYTVDRRAPVKINLDQDARDAAGVVATDEA